MPLSSSFDSPIQNRSASVPYILASGAVVYAGGMVQLDSDGYAVAASGSSANKIVGRATKDYDGTQPDGTQIEVQEGDIFLKLNGSNTPTQANVGGSVYAEDDYQVSTSSSGKAKAGTLVSLATVNGVSGGFVRCTLATT